MKNVKCKIEFFTFISTVSVALVADRLLKFYFQNLPDGRVFKFLPGVEFSYSLNPSLFFLPAWRFIPWFALLVIIFILGFWIWNFSGNWKLEIGNLYHRAFFAIMLGGMSNVYDRFAYGGVIDYVEILGIAAINLADILILLGLIHIIRHFDRAARRSRNLTQYE